METALAPTVDLARRSRVAEGLAAQDFDQLVRLHQRQIYRVLYSLLHDHDLADNLTQECFLRAYQRRATFRGEAKIETWLIRIALNLARDQTRNRRWAFWRGLLPHPAPSQAEGREPTTPDPDPSVERVMIAREQVAAVRSVLKTLSRQQQAAFSLRFFEEMSLEEIAGAMELEVGTIKAHLSRAVGAVRRALRGQK